MVDKLRKTQPLKITFSEGEQPTAQKLSVLANQSRNGADIIERAIGDLWNQAGDDLLIDSPLQIPNLARVLGEQKYVNPALYPFQEEFDFQEKVGARFVGQVVGHLNFRPKAGTTPQQIDAGGQFGVGSRKTNEYEVGDPNNGSPQTNEWYVGEDTGKFRVDSPLLGGEILEYTVDPTLYENTAENMPGVIPDPRQSSFTSCRVSQDSSKYLLHLPPRLPLDFTGSEGFGSPSDRPDKYPIDAEEFSGNFATTAATPYKYWQSASSDALLAAHYRYHLPKEILDAHSGMSSGDEYPQGFMFIYDTATKTIIDDVVFRKPSGAYATRPWVVEIESATYDFSTVETSTEAEADYSSSGLILITCGNPTARALWSVVARQLGHKHDNTDSTARVGHNSLEDVNPPTTAYAIDGHDSRYPSSLPRWSPSRWAMDDHTSLLSRAGSYGDSHANRRDPNDNAMLGHLVLANSVKDANNIYLDAITPDDSFKLYFGAVGGGHIYQDSSQDIHINSNNDFFVDSDNFLLDSTQLVATMGANSLTVNSTTFAAVVGSNSLTLDSTEFEAIAGSNSILVDGTKFQVVAGTAGLELDADEYRADLDTMHWLKIINGGETYSLWTQSLTTKSYVDQTMGMEMGVMGAPSGLDSATDDPSGTFAPYSTVYFFKQAYDAKGRPGVMSTVQAEYLGSSWQNAVYIGFSNTRGPGRHPCEKFVAWVSEAGYDDDYYPIELLAADFSPYVQSTQMLVYDPAAQASGAPKTRAELEALGTYDETEHTGRMYIFENGDWSDSQIAYIGADILTGGTVTTNGAGFPNLGGYPGDYFSNLYIRSIHCSWRGPIYFNSEIEDQNVVEDYDLGKIAWFTPDADREGKDVTAFFNAQAASEFTTGDHETDFVFGLKHVTYDGNFPAREKMRLTSDGLMILGWDKKTGVNIYDLEPTSATWPESRAYCVYMYNGHSSGLPNSEGSALEADDVREGLQSGLWVKELDNDGTVEIGRKFVGIAVREMANGAWGPVAISGIVEISNKLVSASTASIGDMVIIRKNASGTGWMETSTTNSEWQYAIGVVVHRDNNDNVWMKIK